MIGQVRHVARLRVLVALGLLGLAMASAARASADSLTAAAESPILGVTKESKGAVTVALTPEHLRDGRLVVEIKVNTHTVNDLEKYDLTKITTLELEGKVIRPTSAPKLKGHHNSGELVFPLGTLPRAIVIKIRGLDKPELRVFSWP